MPPDRWSSEPRLTPKGGLSGGDAVSVAVGSAALRREPDGSTEQVNQALFGEPARVLERITDREGSEWAYVQLGLDRYVGWMRGASLAPVGPEPTHRVKVLRTFLYERADMKSRPTRAVSMNARMALGETEGNFTRVIGSGWVFARHVSLLTETETDFVGVAQRFVRIALSLGRPRERRDRLLRPCPEFRFRRQASIRCATPTCRNRHSASTSSLQRISLTWSAAISSSGAVMSGSCARPPCSCIQARETCTSKSNRSGRRLTASARWLAMSVASAVSARRSLGARQIGWARHGHGRRAARQPEPYRERG